MATYAITHRQVTDNYLVVQTLEGTDIGTGQSVTLSGLGATLNGTYTVQDVPIYLFLGVDDEGDFIFDPAVTILNQLLMPKTHADVGRGPVSGTLDFTTSCTWITSQMVVDWLGIATATANDTAFITKCVAAANAYAYRRRREAGYFDSLTTVPGGDVELGTIMFAGSLYRERGSVDSFSSFEQMGTPVPFGANGQINRLLGINRSQVA
ncbi:MAG: hypothetical protein ACO3GP_04695 [Candidatus Limnocylindrus sp.]